jgi:tetratricopeptide (TPR) repeat protein
LQAEKEATKAIISTKKNNPWLYNHRAWIRWNMKNFSGAMKDWEQSVEISPQTADFYYNMAMVYEKGRNFPQAVKKINIALKLKPGSKKYLEKKISLQKLQTMAKNNLQ